MLSIKLEARQSLWTLNWSRIENGTRIILGGRAGVVVETLASHHCGPSSIPGIATLFVSEFGCRSIPYLAGFFRVLRFPPASKIGFLPISLSRLIWFSSLCYSCINLRSTIAP